MQNMSKLQEDCFRSREMIKKINMKTVDNLREKNILSKLMLNIKNVTIYT